MTEDFKSKIIAYLCGKYEIQMGENKPTIEEIKDTTNNFTDNLFEAIKNAGIEVYNLYIFGTFQSRNANDEGLDKTIIYGVVDDVNRQINGFVAIADINFNLVQLITKYSSGVRIERLLCLDVDETGNLMGVESRGTGTGTETKRFLLLNNPTVKLPQEAEYQLKIRSAYNLPSNLQQYSYSFIKRRIGGGNYLMYGAEKVGSGNYTPIVIELTINVGSENEWKLYQTSGSGTSSTDYFLTDVWQSWDSENNLDFQMIGRLQNTNLFVYTKDNDSISVSIIPVIDSIETFLLGTAKIKQKNDFYVLSFQYINSGSNGLCEIFNVKNRVVEKIYVNEFTVNNFSEYEDYGNFEMKIQGNDINVFILCCVDVSTFDLYIGRIANNKVYLVEKKAINQPIPNPIVFYNVTKQFNLYNYQFQLINSLYSTLEIYNENNYNGLPYQGLNSMIPNYGILYNNSNIPVFARNLYNKTISGRTTQSTIEVPNTFLNDEIITKENLIGETNSILISNSNTVAKNIYETLDVNFINSLQIRNDNDENNKVLNSTGASRLNNSISETIDYDNAKALKLKFNYSDGTNNIIQLNPIQVDKIDDTTYMYDIDIYVPKEITNLQIISNDETTIYQTITSTFEVGKFYNITQMVEIV